MGGQVGRGGQAVQGKQASKQRGWCVQPASQGKLVEQCTSVAWVGVQLLVGGELLVGVQLLVGGELLVGGRQS